MYILQFYLHSHKVWQWATIQSNVLQLQVNSSIKILPREGCCEFSALRIPKNPKQHTAHSITWSCFIQARDTNWADRPQAFQSDQNYLQVCLHLASPFLCHIFFTPLRMYSRQENEAYTNGFGRPWLSAYSAMLMLEPFICQHQHKKITTLIRQCMGMYQLPESYKF